MARLYLSFLAWLSERLFDVAQWLDLRAIGKPAIRAYLEALAGASQEAARQAINEIEAALSRLPDGSSAETAKRMRNQVAVMLAKMMLGGDK